jgi:hypothetical protein
VTPQLPDVVRRYHEAHDRRDTDAALATFTSDARVVDDGRTYVGTDEVRTFLDTAAAEFTYTRTPLGAVDEGDGVWLETSHIEGDFPGGQVDLGYRFTIVDGLIAELVIAP